MSISSESSNRPDKAVAFGNKGGTAAATTTEKTRKETAGETSLPASGASAVTTAHLTHDIAELTGQGIYQRMLLMCTMLAAFMLTSYTNAIEVLAPPTAHWCKRLPAFRDLTPATWKNMSIPVDEKGRYDRCHRYDPADPNDAGNRTIVPCEDWEYDLKEGVINIVSRWRLVCDRAWLLKLSRITYMLAAMVAVPLSGWISDLVGRRPVVCLSTIVLILGVFAGCFAKTFSFFVVNRMLISATVSIVFITLFVLLFEVNTAPYRVYYSTLVHIGMNLGFFAAFFLSHFQLNYQLIQALFTIPASLLLATVYVTEESPRWLVATWDVVRASHVIIWIGKVNSREAEMGSFMAIIKRYERIVGDATHKPLEELVHANKLRTRLVVMCCCRFYIAFTLHGLVLAQRKLRISWLKYLVVFLRLPALIATYLAVDRLGRNAVLEIAFLTSCAGTLVLALSRMTQDVVVSGVLVTVTKTADTAALLTFFIYSMELFPTPVRNFSFCVTYAFSRLGGATAPLLADLEARTHVSMPFVVMTAVGLVCHHVTQYLPETKNIILMDAFEEVDEEQVRKKLQTVLPPSSLVNEQTKERQGKEVPTVPTPPTPNTLPVSTRLKQRRLLFGQNTGGAT